MERVPIGEALGLAFKRYWIRFVVAFIVWFFFIPVFWGIMFPVGVFLWTWFRMTLYDIECVCETFISPRDRYCKTCGEKVPPHLRWGTGGRDDEDPQ